MLWWWRFSLNQSLFFIEICFNEFETKELLFLNDDVLLNHKRAPVESLFYIVISILKTMIQVDFLCFLWLIRKLAQHWYCRWYRGISLCDHLLPYYTVGAQTKKMWKRHQRWVELFCDHKKVLPFIFLLTATMEWCTNSSIRVALVCNLSLEQLYIKKKIWLRQGVRSDE